MSWYTKDKNYPNVNLNNLQSLRIEVEDLPDKDIYTTEDAYRIHRKSSEFPMTRKEVRIVMKEFSEVCFDLLTEGYQITLPFNLGGIKIKSKEISLTENERGHVIGPVNWKKTLDLWERSEEDKKNKTLIYYTNEHSEFMTYRVSWLKTLTAKGGRLFYHFQITKQLKEKLSKLIKKGWTI